MDILKIVTAGSVDDGKSTLIGRLLYDTRSVTNDKLEAVEMSSKRKGLDFVDLSLLTDGLIAEREQGITIDVAHIYFSTAKRKYIVADSPGHIEYTRNMITGASNATVFIILLDARNGLMEQTRRHLFIASLLQIKTVFVCINKMDLAGYEETVFMRLQTEVDALAAMINYTGEMVYVPIAAKYGDNIVTNSTNMSWYNGKPLLEYLETIETRAEDKQLPLRMQVQLVIRPHSAEHHDFRGYAGKILAGKVAAGDRITVLPSMQESTVNAIHHSGKEIGLALSGQSITIELADDVDVSRGNMIVSSNDSYTTSTNLTATICWLSEEPLKQGSYLLQHGVHTVKSKLTGIDHKLDMSSMQPIKGATDLRLNDIGVVSLKTAKPLAADTFAAIPRNGAFILIDEFTNNTVAVGFILHT